MKSRLIRPGHYIQCQKICSRKIRRPQGAPTERQHGQNLLGKRMIGSCRRCWAPVRLELALKALKCDDIFCTDESLVYCQGGWGWATQWVGWGYLVEVKIGSLGKWHFRQYLRTYLEIWTSVCQCLHQRFCLLPFYFAAEHHHHLLWDEIILKTLGIVGIILTTVHLVGIILTTGPMSSFNTSILEMTAAKRSGGMLDKSV